MTDALILQAALAEVKTKSWGVTDQFLAVHELEYEAGKPIVARIDQDERDTAIVYFPVKGERFTFAVYVAVVPEISVYGVGKEAYSSVYFRAQSDSLSLEQLSQLTQLQSTGGRNKGDLKRPNGRNTARWQESTIFYEPNPEPDAFEDKLRKLLFFLEQDKEGVSRLVAQADGYIQVAIEFHNSNTMLGGPHLNKKVLKRMAALNLAIDFDLYVSGNPFEDDSGT